MKLGKKKDADASVDEKPAKKAVKKEKTSSSGPKLKRLNSVAVSQSLVVVLAGVIAVALLHFLVVQPSAKERFESLKVLEADAAALRLNQYFDQVQKSVNGLATQPHVVQALSSRNEIPATEVQLADSLPGIEAVHLFPYRDIPRTSSSEGLLGFSGLELARRAETGQRLFPDAFPRDNRWFVQMAAPVRNPTSNAVIGSLLIIFDSGQIQPLLQVVNSSLGGQLALVQTVSGSSRTVVSNGSGSGNAESRRLSNPDWTVAYTPAKSSAAPVDTVMIALLVGVPALIAAIIVWVLLGGAQKGLRQDVTALIQWAHKVFGGERVKLPTFRWDMVASTGEVLYRLSQVVDKRVAKAVETAKPRPAGSGKSGGGAAKGGDEPLFQDKDMPDIDMLDGDEDVLGFGSGDDTVFGSGDTPDVEEVALPQVELSQDIFRAYDIRGIVGETLTAEGVEVIGRAIGSEARERGVDSLCIGYDGRHSSPDLADALARGVMAG
ncbi:MAG TPA: phosphomannomutase/phosphoglucomutase, partial [Marinobacter adhaerens]|nr:phosphomannomutase/phosphoglucomutase [Marinobacter adhaerens]